jgi:hypothetical protein
MLAKLTVRSLSGIRVISGFLHREVRSLLCGVHDRGYWTRGWRSDAAVGSLAV